MAGGYALATGRMPGGARPCRCRHRQRLRLATQNLVPLPPARDAARRPRAATRLRGELTASRDTYVHFVRDPFDIASIVRPYVKWEYSLPSGVVVKEALARANAFAQSDPPGPVYMMLRRARRWPSNGTSAAMPAYPPAALRRRAVPVRHRAGARRSHRRAELMAAENPDRASPAYASAAGRGRSRSSTRLDAGLRHSGRRIPIRSISACSQDCAVLRRHRSAGTAARRPPTSACCSIPTCPSSRSMPSSARAITVDPGRHRSA